MAGWPYYTLGIQMLFTMKRKSFISFLSQGRCINKRRTSIKGGACTINPESGQSVNNPEPSTYLLCHILPASEQDNYSQVKLSAPPHSSPQPSPSQWPSADIQSIQIILALVSGVKLTTFLEEKQILYISQSLPETFFKVIFTSLEKLHTR